MARRYLATVAKAVPTDPTCMHCRSKAAGIYVQIIMRQRFIQAATERVSAFGAFGDQIVRSMVYASILHESSCFNTSRAPGSRTPSIIYFQPMKQTRADMLGVEYVCIRLIIPTLSSTRDGQSHV